MDEKHKLIATARECCKPDMKKTLLKVVELQCLGCAAFLSFDCPSPVHGYGNLTTSTTRTNARAT